MVFDQGEGLRTLIVTFIIMDSDKTFLYTGQALEDIPRDITHVIVDPSVKEIGEEAFAGCSQLRNVELCEGLERIGDWAFESCTSLTSIRIPSTVKVIGDHAFLDCEQLVNVELCEGLERIDAWAFTGCESLTSITIPSTVKEISSMAFFRCTSLVAIKFCNEIEQFVNDIPLHWWNHGVSEASLRTYSFLARHNIPARLNLINCREWKDNIHEMFSRIPKEDSGKGKANNLVESQLSNYENLQCGLPILELALWRAKIIEQFDSNIISVENDAKLMCRTHSFAMFAIIFPNVISFFVDEKKNATPLID